MQITSALITLYISIGLLADAALYIVSNGEADAEGYIKLLVAWPLAFLGIYDFPLAFRMNVKKTEFNLREWWPVVALVSFNWLIILINLVR